MIQYLNSLLTGVHIYCRWFDDFNFCETDFFSLKQVRIGNRSYLSKIDIQQVNMMYRCNGGGGGNPHPPPPGEEIKTSLIKPHLISKLPRSR